MFRVSAWPMPLLLAVLLAGALALRMAAFLTQTYVVFRDETFQYFEQGHRLAFGTGVLPWEFHDGIRSVLLPGLIAGAMRVASLIGDDPAIYVTFVRTICALLSLVVVFVGFRSAEPNGRWAAILTGGICVLWFDLIYFAPSAMTEVLAAHCGIVAIWLAGRGRMIWAGVLFGLACCLRYQYGPALLAAFIWQIRFDWRRWRALATGAMPVAIAIGGVLDWIVWGSPFQSIWLNVMRNSVQGVSTAMGTEPALFYPAYLWVAFWPLPLLGLLAALGATRMPALAIAAAITLLLHSAIPHKEVRFIYLALACAPVLIGFGAIRVLGGLDPWRRGLGVAVLLSAIAAISWTTATTPPLSARWSFERANIQAFLAAHAHPGLCGLGVKDIQIFDSGGYTYLHRDVPVYFEDFDPAMLLPGSVVTLRLAVRRAGQDVPQFPGLSLDGASHRYNALIAQRGNAGAIWSPTACFTDVTRAGLPPLCLYARTGGCS